MTNEAETHTLERRSSIRQRRSSKSEKPAPSAGDDLERIRNSPTSLGNKNIERRRDDLRRRRSSRDRIVVPLESNNDGKTTNDNIGPTTNSQRDARIKRRSNRDRLSASQPLATRRKSSKDRFEKLLVSSSSHHSDKAGPEAESKGDGKNIRRRSSRDRIVLSPTIRRKSNKEKLSSTSSHHSETRRRRSSRDRFDTSLLSSHHGTVSPGTQKGSVSVAKITKSSAHKEQLIIQQQRWRRMSLDKGIPSSTHGEKSNDISKSRNKDTQVLLSRSRSRSNSSREQRRSFLQSTSSSSSSSSDSSADSFFSSDDGEEFLKARLGDENPPRRTKSLGAESQRLGLVVDEKKKSSFRKLKEGHVASQQSEKFEKGVRKPPRRTQSLGAGSRLAEVSLGTKEVTLHTESRTRSRDGEAPKRSMSLNSGDSQRPSIDNKRQGSSKSQDGMERSSHHSRRRSGSREPPVPVRLRSFSSTDSERPKLDDRQSQQSRSQSVEPSSRSRNLSSADNHKRPSLGNRQESSRSQPGFDVMAKERQQIDDGQEKTNRSGSHSARKQATSEPKRSRSLEIKRRLRSLELRNSMMKDRNTRHGEILQNFNQQMGMSNDPNAEKVAERRLQTEMEASKGPPRKDALLGNTSDLEDADDDDEDDVLSEQSESLLEFLQPGGVSEVKTSPNVAPAGMNGSYHSSAGDFSDHSEELKDSPPDRKDRRAQPNKVPSKALQNLLEKKGAMSDTNSFDMSTSFESLAPPSLASLSDTAEGNDNHLTGHHIDLEDRLMASNRNQIGSSEGNTSFHSLRPPSLASDLEDVNDSDVELSNPQLSYPEFEGVNTLENATTKEIFATEMGQQVLQLNFGNTQGHEFVKPVVLQPVADPRMENEETLVPLKGGEEEFAVLPLKGSDSKDNNVSTEGKDEKDRKGRRGSLARAFSFSKFSSKDSSQSHDGGDDEGKKGGEHKKKNKRFSLAIARNFSKFGGEELSPEPEQEKKHSRRDTLAKAHSFSKFRDNDFDLLTTGNGKMTKQGSNSFSSFSPVDLLETVQTAKTVQTVQKKKSRNGSFVKATPNNDLSEDKIMKSVPTNNKSRRSSLVKAHSLNRFIDNDNSSIDDDLVKERTIQRGQQKKISRKGLAKQRSAPFLGI